MGDSAWAAGQPGRCGAAVPEAASVALVLFGLAGMAAARRSTR
jgi:hypothetical protein